MPGAVRSTVVLGVAIGLALGLAPPIATDLDAGSATPARGRSLSTASAGPSLAVDPSSWWLETGSNLTLTATWVGTPAGCWLQTDWFRWTIAPGGSYGVLEPSNGSAATFLAADQGTGETTVAVEAAATEHCRGNLTAVSSTASAVVTVAGLMVVGNLSVEPDPVAAGQATDLIGVVAGGEAPYQLRISWGDGNVSLANVSRAGPFAVPYRYDEAGAFRPTLVVTDAAGEAADGAVEEPAYVSLGFAVALTTSATVADVGVPVVFGVETLHAPANFSWLFACDDATPTGGGNGSSLGFGCAFETPGASPVTFEAVGASLPFAIATAELDEVVVAPPTLSFSGPGPAGEVGRPLYAAFTIVGGVPPFSVSWSLVGAASRGTMAVSSDGLGYLPLGSPVPGTLVLSAVVVDALGVASPTATENATIAPPLSVQASATAEVTNGTVAVNVSGSAVEGVAPFAWAVVPAAPSSNGSANAGTLAQAAAFGWNGTYRAEGPLALSVVVVDADGAVVSLDLSVELAPPLAVAIEAGPDGPGGVTLTMTISGGVGPFAYRWNDSVGDLWNGTVARDGTLTLRESPSTGGRLTFGLAVVDALGASASARATANVSAPTTEGAGATSGVALAGAAAVVAVIGAAVAILRRRRATAPEPAVDPVAILREVISPSDGVDRGLVEMLAEERGVPREVVRATLERLKDDGIVRSGAGNDGEEVLAWTEPTAR